MRIRNTDFKFNICTLPLKYVVSTLLQLHKWLYHTCQHVLHLCCSRHYKRNTLCLNCKMHFVSVHSDVRNAAIFPVS